MESNYTIVDKIYLENGLTDKKHILNTSTNEVNQTILDKIETEGVTIEQLNEFQERGLNIYMYQTQITIHGIFPELCNNYLSGYKTLFQNKNKSIGVKWNGIDNRKKQIIYNKLSYFGWDIRHNSTEWKAFKMKPVKDKQEANEYSEQFKKEIVNLDTNLFYGSKAVYLAKGMFGVYCVCEVCINGLLDININKVIEQITNKPINEVEQIIADIKQKEAEKQIEYKKQCEANRIIEAEKRAKYEAEKTEWANSNPIKNAVYVKDNKIANGQIYANPSPKSGGWEWEFVGIKKIGANLCCYKCDKQGNKLQKAVQCYSKTKTGYLLQSAADNNVNKQMNNQPEQKLKINQPVKEITSGINIINYSDRSIAVIGDTKPIKDNLKELGGRFNMYLNCGAGWIFPKSKEQEVRKVFNL